MTTKDTITLDTLLDEIEQIRELALNENDFQKAWLSTFSESEIAIAFYKRRGFRIMVETDVEIGGKNYHEIVMEKSFLT